MSDFLRLLLGTVIYRPYVYGFFVCFLFFALKHLGAKKTSVFLVSSYLIAYVCEYSATRNGFPFGIYTYIDDTRSRELWLSNIPFWDSLSFVFLSYFSWVVAASLISPRDFRRAWLSPWTPVLGGLLMMLLDVVIDPLTLLGDRWFLGRIYYYPQGGTYFGVTLSNFAGWWFVGWLSQFAFQKLWRFFNNEAPQELPTWFTGGVFGVYAGVFLFNLSITAYIREWPLFWASSVVVGVTLGLSFWRLTARFSE